MTGRPTNTALAPKARAFRTSVPNLTPPSTYTSTPDPRTASTISGNTSICQKNILILYHSNNEKLGHITFVTRTVAWTPSNCRPPHLTPESLEPHAALRDEHPTLSVFLSEQKEVTWWKKANPISSSQHYCRVQRQDNYATRSYFEVPFSFSKKRNLQLPSAQEGKSLLSFYVYQRLEGQLLTEQLCSLLRGGSRGRVQGVRTPPPEKKLSSYIYTYSLLKFCYLTVSDVIP